MNQKTLLAILALLVGCFASSFAQEAHTPVSLELENPEGQEIKHNAYKTSWVKNRFKDTWYITFGSGAQILLAEDDDKGSFKDRITYAPSITIGKYFSPIWGLRAQFTGGSLHGFNDGNAGTYRIWNKGGTNYMGGGHAGMPGYPKDNNADFFTWDPQWNYMGYSLENGEIGQEPTGPYQWNRGRNGELYMQHVRYAAVNLTFMFDFLTLVGNYDPKRSFDFTPFLGVSYAHLFPNLGSGFYDCFGVNGGINFKFRLGSKFDLNFEGTMTAYPDDFDGHIGGARSMDLVAQATAGITYKIGKSTWEVSDPMNYEMIRNLNDEISRLRVIAEQGRDCPECPKCPSVEDFTDPTRQDGKTVFLPDPVFFRIDKSIIDSGEWWKIEKAVDYLNRNSDVNVILTGYADKKTAYPAYNMRLSERRAKTVSKALIEKYGINPLRISINWEGDKIQPFEINEWNRVVIFVIDK